MVSTEMTICYCSFLLVKSKATFKAICLHHQKLISNCLAHLATSSFTICADHIPSNQAVSVYEQANSYNPAKMPTVETICQEKADWEHGNIAMVSIKLYKRQTEKWGRAKRCIYTIVGPGWVHKERWDNFREKRKTLQQQMNVLGEYKTENYKKPLVNLIWAYAPYCLTFVQKFIQEQGKC